MTTAAARAQSERLSVRAAIVWGFFVGGITVALPLGIWWLDAATVLAMSIAVIASVYIGFAVADGRRRVIVVESLVAVAFIIIAAAAVTGWVWLLVIGYVGHGGAKTCGSTAITMSRTRGVGPPARTLRCPFSLL